VLAMKSWVYRSGMMLVTGILVAMAAGATHLKVGDKAPDFTLPASTGGQISLSQFLGKQTVVLAFFPAAFTGG